MSSESLKWLLGEDQPSIRYRALTDLEGRPEADSDVQRTRSQIAKVGWAADILRRRNSDGLWEDSSRLYLPKYLSTNWQLLALSDLGLTKAHPGVRRACEVWIKKYAKSDGGFGAENSKMSHECIAGNTARALVKFGYVDHPAVRRSFDWMVQHASHLGGWSCWGSGRNLDTWEPLSAFAAYPRSKWTKSMTESVERAAEFFLERELHRQGDRYAPWYRTHYPNHYYYDLLVGLDVLTSLGYTQDSRLRFALDWLKERRTKDGRWKLDAVQPDIEGPIAAWYAKHPKHMPTPLAFEAVGRPSKMVTLVGTRILARVAA